MSLFLIYGLIDPRTGGIRYIGKSCSGMKRVRRHGRERGRTLRHRWLTQLQDLGLQHGVVILETFTRGEDLALAERFWISQGQAMKWNLVNGTKGEGGGMLGRRHSAETRAKMSAASRGRPKSEEHRAALSRSITGRALTQEHREKIRSGLLSYLDASGTRERLRTLRSRKA